jgi:hypothetical protein
MRGVVSGLPHIPPVGRANCTKWLIVRTGSERLQMRDAVCVDKIRA